MEFKLLYYLLRHEEQVLSREQILNEVWGHLASVTDRTVDTHIYTIRQKLGPHAACIQSVPRAGCPTANANNQQSALVNAQDRVAKWKATITLVVIAGVLVISSSAQAKSFVSADLKKQITRILSR